MSAHDDKSEQDLPISLTGHEPPISPEQMAGIAAHVETMAKAALAVSDRLPIGADSTDVFRVLRPKEG